AGIGVAARLGVDLGDDRADGVFFFSSRRRHTRLQGDWSSDVCSSDLIVKRLFDATGGVLQNAEVNRALAKEGTEASGSRSPQDFAAFLAEDTLLWTRLVKESGAKPD